MAKNNDKRKQPDPKTVVVPFPVKGVDRSLPVSQQPPFTCPDALNVVAFPPLSDRGGGGKRDGTVRESQTLLTGVNSNSINLLLAYISTSSSLAPSGGGIPETWVDLAGGLAGSSAAGTCLATYPEPTDLYIGGTFTVAGGSVTAENFAKFDIDTGEYSVPSAGLPDGRQNPGRFLVWDAGDGSGECLYVVGGTHTSAVKMNQICRFNGTTWTDLGADTVGVTSINDLCVVGSRLFVCGRFSQLGSNVTSTGAGGGCNNMAYWDPLLPIGNWFKVLDPTDSTHNGVTSAGTPVAYSMATMRIRKSVVSSEQVDMLFVGGNFTQGGGIANCYNTGQFDCSNGVWNNVGGVGAGPLVTAGPAVAGIVQRLACLDVGNGQRLYIGGCFSSWSNGSSLTTVGSNVRGTHPSDHALITSWDGVNFQPLRQGLRGKTDTLGYGVQSIEFYNDGISPGVYVAGRFHSASSSDGLGLAAPSVAKWDGVDWTVPPVGLAGGGVTGEFVRHLIPAGDTNDQHLYGTGLFTVRNNKAVCGIGNWSGTEWTSFAGGGVQAPGAQTFNSLLYPCPALMSDATARFYVSVYNEMPAAWKGCFGCGPVGAADSKGARYTLATWDGVKWSVVPSFAPTSLSTQFAYTMAAANLQVASVPQGTKLYVGGSFTAAGGCPFNYIAAYTGAAWEALGTGVTAEVYAIELDPINHLIYVGGAFGSSVGPVAGAGGVAGTAKMAIWDGAAWTANAGGSGAGVSGATSTVDCFCWDSINARMYIGGKFPSIGGVADTRNVALNQVGPCDKGLNERVRDLTMFNSDLYACGNFTADGNGTAMLRIARFDKTSWSAVGGGLTGGEARSMYVHDDGSGSKLYVGGAFTAFVNNSVSFACRGIARWNSVTSLWENVAAPDAYVQGFGSRDIVPNVTALNAYGGQLVAAGGIWDAEGDFANRFVRGDTL